jgi:hypothetical protein
MRQSDVAKNPTRENVLDYVYGKLYFQGQPITQKSSLATNEKPGPNLTKSAIGHLLPISALHRINPGSTPQKVLNQIKEVAPDALPIFEKNEDLIRQLEKISRTVPKGRPFRTFLREQFKMLREGSTA